MNALYNRKSLRLGIPGLIVQQAWILGLLHNGQADQGQPHPEWIDILLVVLILGGMAVGTILLGIGLCYYAKAKGYPAAVGLVGLLGIFGLLVLILLRDKLPQQAVVQPCSNRG
jgi:hypothetical protein